MSDSENEEPTVPIRSVRIVEPKPKQSGFFSWFGVNNDEDDESEAEADDVQSDGESISIMPSSVTAGDLTSIVSVYSTIFILLASSTNTNKFFSNRSFFCSQRKHTIF